MKKSGLILFLLFWHLGLQAWAQSCPVSLTYVPIPIDIDGVRTVPSHFYLTIPFGPCDVLLADAKPKSTEAVVAAIDRALIQGDLSAYQKTFSPQADTNEPFIRAIFKQQSALFQKEPPDRITQKYNLGQLAYFVVGDAVHPFLNHEVIIRSLGKSDYNGRSYTSNPLVENLDAVVTDLPDDFKNFPAPPAGDYFKVAYVLPYDHGPVTCAFQGELLDLDVSKTPLSSYQGRYADLIAFYADTFNDLRQRHEAAYLGRFSPESSAQQKAAIDQMSFEDFAYNNSHDVRNVRFVLDADPVYFIFWNLNDEDGLQYDTLLKTGVGQYEWVNTQHHTSLDHLFADKSFIAALQTLVVGADR